MSTRPEDRPVVTVVVPLYNEESAVGPLARRLVHVLESVGSCGEGADANDPSECKTWADRYQRDILNVDFKANYRLNDRVSFYFDALNLTEEDDLRYPVSDSWARSKAASGNGCRFFFPALRRIWRNHVNHPHSALVVWNVGSHLPCSVHRTTPWF